MADRTRGDVLQDQIRDAIVTELTRQSSDPDCDLTFREGDPKVGVAGEIDLDALVFVIIGSLAGGP